MSAPDRLLQRFKETDWQTVAWGMQGVTHLAVRSAAEVAELVTDMHGTINQAPLPLGQVEIAPRESAPWPYRLVSGVLRHAARLLVRWPLQADITPSQGLALSVLSAANGVLGDKLERWRSPLALGMTLRDGVGEPAAWSLLADSPKARVALFIHGLCLSEQEWHTPAHDQFAELLGSKGWRSGWLRYNSGRALWRNGSDLADWLEMALAAHPVRELVLVGHSQGGLMIRSAFVHAQARGHAWPERVSRAAYLATPHQGAPLERAGNWANAILSHSPYTAPLMRLGNIRSAAIKDLRFGLLTESESEAASDTAHHDHREAAHPLPSHVHHFLLAGEVDMASELPWVGDGLVPVTSALGLHDDPALVLDAPSLQRLQLPRLGHMAMLSDVRVWDALADWWFSR